MFHNTHVYFASKLYKSEESLLLVGSFLPDIAVTGIIKWEGGLHGFGETDDFKRFIQKNYSNFISLTRGVLAHNILDNFTHHRYGEGLGYAYQNNEELVVLVANYYSLDEKKARSVAHNCIEIGVDIMLLRKYPNVPKKIDTAIKLTDIKELSVVLSSYFEIDNKKFYQALVQYFDVFTKYDLTKFDSWSSLWGDLEKMLALKDIGSQKRNELFLKSADIVTDTYQYFLNYTLKQSIKRTI